MGRFTKVELLRARTLRGMGLSWRPRRGDWYCTDDGFVSFVTANGDALHAAQHHTWIPAWHDCRKWLIERGFTHPEFARDDPDCVRIEVMSSDGEIVVGTGATDLECLFEIVSGVLRSHGT